MTLNDASSFFNNLMTETNVKSELRLYKKFAAILSDLTHKDLSERQMQSVEKELHSLNLETPTENKRKYFRRKLSQFTQYLKSEFSFVTEGYYTAIGMSMGVAFGVAFGAAMQMGTGIAVGIAIGLAIGAGLDAKAKKENRVLKTKLNK